MLLHKIDEIIDIGECKSGNRIRRTIIDRHSAGCGIDKCRAREADVRHKAPRLIFLFRRENEVLAAVFHNGRLINVKDGSSDRIDKSVAGAAHSMIEKKPALTRLNGCRAAADFDGFPPFRALSHDVTVSAPINEVRALGKEDIAKRSVSGVRRS